MRILMRRCNRCSGCCAVNCGLCRECQVAVELTYPRTNRKILDVLETNDLPLIPAEVVKRKKIMSARVERVIMALANMVLPES